MHSILPCLHDHWKIKSNYMNRGTRAIKINEKCKNAMCNHYYFGVWMATGNLLTSNHIVSKLHISAVKWNPTLRPQKPLLWEPKWWPQRSPSLRDLRNCRFYYLGWTDSPASLSVIDMEKVPQRKQNEREPNSQLNSLFCLRICSSKS